MKCQLSFKNRSMCVFLRMKIKVCDCLQTFIYAFFIPLILKNWKIVFYLELAHYDNIIFLSRYEGIYTFYICCRYTIIVHFPCEWRLLV